MVLGRALVFGAAYDGRAMRPVHNAKRTLRLFGSGQSCAPVGLRCWHCDAPFAHDATGVWFERAETCYPSHALCFANAAVSEYLARYMLG